MRWRFLLRPSWIALTLVSVAFAAFAFLVLGPWQFHRGEERSVRNTAIEQSFATPPAPLRAVLPAGAAPGRSTQWRQVELTGEYVAGAEVVARLRTVQGEPAFEVLAPFRLDDGTTVLVNRGFLRPAPGILLPEYPPAPSGEVTVQGRLRIGEPVDRRSVERDGATQVYAASAETVGLVSGLAIEPGYVQLNEGQPGVLGALPLPQLSAGPHFAYALQWLAFGAMVPLGVAYFAWREGTGERRSPDPRDDDPHDRPAPASTTAHTVQAGHRIAGLGDGGVIGAAKRARQR